MRIVQISIERTSKAKAELVSNKFYNVDILALQETNIPDDHIERLKVSVFQLIDFIGHIKHGVAIFENLNLDQNI